MVGIALLLAGCTSPGEERDGGPDPLRDAGCAAASPQAPLVGAPDQEREPPRRSPLLPFGVARATSPSPPLALRLAVCDPAGLFGETGSEVVLSLATPHADAQRVTAGVALPPGVEVVSGRLAFDGPLTAAASPLRLRAVVRAEEPGPHVLRGWAELPGWATNGSRSALRDLVGVRGDAARAEDFEPNCTAPPPTHASATPAACGIPPPGLQVTMRAAPDDPTRVTGRVALPAAMGGPVNARVMFWTGAELEGGWRVWQVRLEPGVPAQFSAQVRLPDDWVRGDGDGFYEVWLYAYPHASVDGGIGSAAMHYTSEGGEARAHQGPAPP